MSQTDTLIPFAFESLPVRGALVQLSRSWQRMQAGHDYRQPVLSVLGHAAAASTLIAQGLKYDSRVTVQLSGNGSLSMLVVQCNSRLELRGMAHARVPQPNAGFAELTAGATCAITLDGGAIERPCQGIVEVSGESLADSLEGYYARSAQIPTHITLLGDATLAGGLLLQQVPERGGPDSDDWRRLGLLARTLSARDLARGVGMDLLAKLFAEDDLRVFRARNVVFRCGCSRARTEEVLRMLGEADARAALREQGVIVVTCEYCGRTRRFDEVDVARLFAGPTPPGSGALH